MHLFWMSTEINRTNGSAGTGRIQAAQGTAIGSIDCIASQPQLSAGRTLSTRDGVASQTDEPMVRSRLSLRARQECGSGAFRPLRSDWFHSRGVLQNGFGERRSLDVWCRYSTSMIGIIGWSNRSYRERSKFRPDGTLALGLVARQPLSDAAHHTRSVM
jgi:hypothetical protein